MLPRVVGAVPPPRKPRRPEGGSFHFGCFHPGLPGRFFCACPPSPPAAHPTPPYPRICALELTDQKTREKKQGTQRAGWGGRTFWAGGVCVGAPEESRAEGSASGSSLPGAAGAALDCCALVVEHAGRGGAGRARSTQRAPSPGGTRASLVRRLQPTRVPPMATNQREAGWAGSRERLLFRRGWRPGAAWTVSLCSSLTVSLTPRREEPRPAAGPPPALQFLKR